MPIPVTFITSRAPGISVDTSGDPLSNASICTLGKQSVREGSAMDAQALRAHVGAHLAAYKVPAIVQVLTEALPRNPAGKLLKAKLRSAFIEGSEA